MDHECIRKSPKFALPEVFARKWLSLVGEECTNTANVSDLAMLRYAHENGCPWSEKTWYGAYTQDAVDCLEYLYKNGCPRDRIIEFMSYYEDSYKFMQSKKQAENTAATKQ